MRDAGEEPAPRELQAEAEEPTRDLQMSMVIACWHDLDTCRDIGMALGPIPWTSIIAWADVAELDLDATRVLVVVIRKLDSNYLSAIAAKRRLNTPEG